MLVNDKNIHFVIMRFRVNKCEVQEFHEMHARLCSPNNLLLLHQIINRT